MGYMIHEILPVGPLQCNCSVIGDEVTREAMVIDPGDDIDDIVAILKLTFTACIAFGTATATLVGQSLGAKRPEDAARFARG